MYRHRLLFLTLSVFLAAGCAASATPTSAEPLAPTPVSVTDIPDTPLPTKEDARLLVAGQWNMLFYHPLLEKIILVNGGPDRGKPSTDPLELWAWEDAHWSLVSADPEGPTWRNFVGAAFDTRRNVLVLHSGIQDAGRRLDETWEWDGQAWTRFDGPGPGFREGAVMVYDAARGEMVLFGGGGEDLEMLGDTWTWDGSEWTQASTSGPAPRFPSAMVYDAAREVVLLYSGHSVSGDSFVDYDDLWAWDGASWTEIAVQGGRPGPRNIAQLLFYPPRQEVLLVGGGDEEFQGDVWSWDGAAWIRITEGGAPARSGMGGAYDPGRERVVLFGGVDRPGGVAISDTWEWDGSAWSCVWGCS